MEKELRHKIFIRGQKGTELTEFGHAFIKYGQEILESYQNILAAAQCTEQTMQNAKFGISVYYLLFANRIFYQLYKKYRSHIALQEHPCQQVAVADLDLFFWPEYLYNFGFHCFKQCRMLFNSDNIYICRRKLLYGNAMPRAAGQLALRPEKHLRLFYGKDKIFQLVGMDQIQE
mgnify:CR=1 FL=1